MAGAMHSRDELSIRPESSATVGAVRQTHLQHNDECQPVGVASWVTSPLTQPMTSDPTSVGNIALQAILGESASTKPSERLSSPLGVHVSKYLREKIWNGQFVELALLPLNIRPLKTMWSWGKNIENLYPR